METVAALPVILGALLVVLGGLALVGWVGVWSGRGRPAPVRLDEGGSHQATHSAAATVALGLERAEGVAGLGRHDERRCAF
jgi:hypothetical protein